jgi:hypothetical protein
MLEFWVSLKGCSKKYSLKPTTLMKMISPFFSSAKPQKQFVLSMLLLPVFGLSASAETLASWDTWGSGSVSGSDYNYSADSTLTGFSATITQVGNTTDRRTDNAWGSNDGTFGGAVSGAVTSGNALFVAATYADTFLITLTNDSATGQSYQIDSFHFDFAPRESNDSTNYGFNAFSLTYTSGGLAPDDTLIDLQADLDYVLIPTSVNLSNYPDYDFNSSAVLNDLVLASGESAVFTLVFSGNVGWNGKNVSSILDNVAFAGQAVIPEPSSAALLVSLSAGMLLLRRRRRA